MVPNLKLSKQDGDLIQDRELYRRIVGKLMYLTITRPDITFAVNKLCQFSSAPRTSHLQAMYKVLQYIKGTVGQGIYKDLINFVFEDLRNQIGLHALIVDVLLQVLQCFLVHRLLHGDQRKKPTLSRASAEAEYRALALATCEMAWLSTLLKDL